MNIKIGKPFIKWVGGKTQLLPHLTDIINKIYPNKKITNYVEPFVGGGAVFFWLFANNRIENAVISDVNEDLILTYKTVQLYPKYLINHLKQLEQRYISVNNLEREAMFYEIRQAYNLEKEQFEYNELHSEAYVTRASKFIFLNKTCFNGLYRQNNKGGFNVPFGKYKSPNICDEDNLINCATALNGVTVLCGDFKLTENLITKGGLVYLDPPYKPITATSSFTKYHKGDFNDSDQIRLADYYKRIDRVGAKIILSNSDPMSVNSNNKFFDDLYSDFNIARVNVSRNISALTTGRQIVKELIIKNAGFR